MKIFSLTILVDKRPILSKAIMPLLFVVALFLWGCDKPIALTKLSGQTMGTYWQVTIAQALDDSQQATLLEHIEITLTEVNQSMSTYIADSELSVFNHASAQQPHPLSESLLTIIDAALTLSEQTNGRYDITIAPLVNLWGFGPDEVNEAPTPEQIESTLAMVGYQGLKRVGGSVVKASDGMMIDLSSIAKGYGVDKVAQSLSTLGYRDFLVDIGGEVLAVGDKYGKPWKVAVEKPVNGREIQSIIALNDGHTAIASSGNYRNFIDYDGERVVHTIDPITGYPVRNTLLSSTVITDNCMMADAYATALMVLDEEAIAFANRHQLAAILIYSSKHNDFNVVYSDAYMQRFGEK